MKSAGSRTLLLRLERGPPLARGRQYASSVAWLVGSYPKHSAWCLLVAARQQKQSTQCTSKESQLTMRRATSGASIGPLSKQLTPILSVAAHEGPYAFKFKGLTLWLAKMPCLKLRGAFRRRATRRLTCAVLEDAAAAPPPAQTAQNARRGQEIPSRCNRDSAG